MVTKKAKPETKKVQPQDPVKDWKSRLEAIAKERQANEEHKTRLQDELRRLTGNRKAHEVHIKEQAAIEFKAQKDKSSGALVDSIFKMDKGKIPESVQLELNIMALQGALSECHAEAKRLEAEENMHTKKINEHIIIQGIHSFNNKREEFTRAYKKLRELFDDLIAISRENASLNNSWVQLMGKTTTPEEIEPKTKLDYQFTLMFESGKLPTRTLINTLERLRGFQGTYGPNPFADVPSKIEGHPSDLMRDNFLNNGPVMNKRDAELEQVIDRAIAGF